MAGERIVVGFDGTRASRQALTWAVREAARRRGRVLVVRAWETGGSAATPATTAALRAERVRLDEQMREAILSARLELAVNANGGPAPVIARELIIATPETALCHAARMADVVVVGEGPVLPTALARRLARRRHRFGGPCPLLVVVPDTAIAPPVPARRSHVALATAGPKVLSVR